MDDALGLKVIEALVEQLDSGGGYFARFDGPAPYEWMRDHGLLEQDLTLIRVFDYGVMSGAEFYVILPSGKLSRMADGSEHHPIELLKSSKSGWEVQRPNREGVRKLAAQAGG